MTAANPNLDVPVRDLGPGGVHVVRIVTFDGGRQTERAVSEKLRQLAELALDAYYNDPIVQTVARTVTAGVSSPARALHAFVRDWIQYEDEPVESLETPRYTLLRRLGDCDAEQVLLAALCLAAGLSYVLVPMGGTPDDPEHLTGMVGPPGGKIAIAAWRSFEDSSPPPPGYAWTETILKFASFGQPPGELAEWLRD